MGLLADHTWHNPVLWHELRHTLRLYRKLGGSPGVRITSVTLLATGYLLALLLWSCTLTNPSDGQSMLILGLVLLGLVLGLLAPGLTATTLVSERQRGSWDMLLMTPLRPAQVVLGKFAGRLLGPLLIVLPALPFLTFAALVAGRTAAGILVTAVLVYPATLLGFTTIGLVCSARARTAAAATAGAYAVTIFLVILVPIAEVVIAELSHAYRDPLVTAVTCPVASFVWILELVDDGRSYMDYETLGFLGPLTYLAITYFGLRTLVTRFEPWLRGDRTR